jgi:signal transduction histidine kinase
MTVLAPANRTEDRLARLERRATRERNARLQAEALLETKSRELYGANLQLLELTAGLERRFEERTRELAAERERAMELAAQIARSEREVVQYVERLEAAIANMGRGLSMFDAEQRLVVCNRAYREIYDLPESLTQPSTGLAEIVRFHVHREKGRSSASNIEKQAKWVARHVARLARGKSFTYTQTLSGGRVIVVTTQPLQKGGWVDIQEDVTEKHNYARLLEQRVAEKTREIAEQAEELRRSNIELERFASVASHDLQEPLRMVASYTQLLGRRYKGQLDANADEFIHFAVEGATRMQALIDDLIMYSRVSTKGQSLRSTDCEEVVDHALANLRAAREDSGAIIMRDAMPTVTADGSQLLRLFQNLISNAIKFRGNRSPEIHVGAERNACGWVFSVRDNGIGIDAKYAHQLFVIFKRLHTRSEYPGTGIGLAICKKIVERHGGRIWFESLPDKGATFFFTLPDRTQPGPQREVR